jgi:thiol:disulfide interchange protein DsbC
VENTSNLKDHMQSVRTCAATAALLAAALLGGATYAQTSPEAVIRKNISERLPKFPQIEEVTKTPMKGVYEIRVNGSDLFYTDATGEYLMQGTLIDTKARRNLTEDRIAKLTEIAFSSLPLNDAFKVVRGNGKRKMAVFEDPNCGYCKRFERDLQSVNDVTVYMFLYPILSPDSTDKSRDVWCAKDRATAWQDMMVRDQTLPPGKCDTAAIERTLAFGKKYKINSTPTTIFADGSRVAGAVGTAQIEKLLAEAR